MIGMTPLQALLIDPKNPKGAYIGDPAKVQRYKVEPSAVAEVFANGDLVKLVIGNLPVTDVDNFATALPVLRQRVVELVQDPGPVREKWLTQQCDHLVDRYRASERNCEAWKGLRTSYRQHLEFRPPLLGGIGVCFGFGIVLGSCLLRDILALHGIKKALPVNIGIAIGLSTIGLTATYIVGASIRDAIRIRQLTKKIADDRAMRTGLRQQITELKKAQSA